MQLFSFLYIFVIIMGSSRSLLTVAQQVVRLESQGYRRMMQMACPCSIIVVTSDMQIRCRYTLIHRTTRPSCVLFFFPCGCEINCALFAQSRSAPSDRLKKTPRRFVLQFARLFVCLACAITTSENLPTPPTFCLAICTNMNRLIHPKNIGFILLYNLLC